jgi:hypothetical protein
VLLDLVQFDQALLPDRVDDRDGVADQLGVAVLVQPVQRRGGRPGRVEAWRHDDDDLVGQLEDSLCGRFQDTGSGVEQDQVVVALQQGDGPAVLLLAQGGGDARVVVGGDHLQAGRGLVGVGADVGVADDLLLVGEQVGDGGRGLAADPVA